MVKSNPSLLKRRAKRPRRRSAKDALQRTFGAVLAAGENLVRGVLSASFAAAMSSPSNLRRNRRRLAGCAVLLTLLFVLMGGTGTTAPSLLFLRSANRQASALGQAESLIDSDAGLSSSPYFLFPVVNLWPNDVSQSTSHANKKGSHQFVIVRCLDEDPVGDPCRLAQLKDEEPAAVEDVIAPERVGVVRSPGRIGMALEDAVRIMIINQTEPILSGETSRDVDLIPTSFVEMHVGGAARPDRNSHNDEVKCERIVRIAIQPLLLDVMDLTLEASESNDEITLEGALCVLRLLVQWHCHHNMVTVDVTAASVLTLSAQQILSHPTDVRKRLAWYLNRNARDVHEHTINEWMNAISHTILQRVDECSQMATQLQRNLHPNQDLHELVDQTVQDEAALCRSDTGDEIGESGSALTTSRCDAGGGDGRLAEIVEILLSVPDANDLRRHDSASLCGRFPSIRFCQIQSPNEHQIAQQ